MTIYKSCQVNLDRLALMSKTITLTLTYDQYEALIQAVYFMEEEWDVRLKRMDAARSALPQPNEAWQIVANYADALSDLTAARIALWRGWNRR